MSYKKNVLEKNMDSSKLQLNGPTNVVRLEGEVDGIKKVVYLFMDFHYNLLDQTKCGNYYSEDIDKYLAKFMREDNEKTNVMYDLFFEDRPTNIHNDIINKQTEKSSRINHKNNYISTVTDLFRNMFKYEMENEKVKQSDFTKKFRFHYMDMRDKLYDHYFRHVSYIYEYITKLNYNIFRPSDLGNIMSFLEGVEENIMKVIDAEKNFKNIKTVSIKKFETFDEDSTKKYFYKIRCMYKNKNIQDILNREIDKLMEKYRSIITDIKNIKEKIVDVDNILKMYDNGYDLKEEYKNLDEDYILDVRIVPDILRDLTVFAINLFDDVLNTNGRLTDIYALRRLLDKKYITNCIMYTGAAHSCDYVYILTHYFDFKITHVAYSFINDIDQLNKKVKQVELDDVMMLLMRQHVQCSDITSFPKNFM